MDPDACLELIRDKCCEFSDASYSEDKEQLLLIADQLIDAITGMDNWLTHKGFLPKDWQR